MHSPEDLEFIRAAEISRLAAFFPPKSHILEIGAGTGHQARELKKLGFEVTAIDLPSPHHAGPRVYPVTDYDGVRIPFPDRSFDAIFSANVLEHVRDLGTLLRETRRVLKPDGYSIHAVPSPFWRLWTSVSGPVDIPVFLFSWCRGRAGGALDLVKGVYWRCMPIKHGEAGNAITELWTFRRLHWNRIFREHGLEVESSKPIGIIYTGWSILGHRLSIRQRERAAKIIGSAAYIYKLRFHHRLPA